MLSHLPVPFPHRLNGEGVGQVNICKYLCSTSLHLALGTKSGCRMALHVWCLCPHPLQPWRSPPSLVVMAVVVASAEAWALEEAVATPMVAALEVASVPAVAEAWVLALTPLEAALPASSTLLLHPPVGKATSTEILAGPTKSRSPNGHYCSQTAPLLLVPTPLALWERTEVVESLHFSYLRFCPGALNSHWGAWPRSSQHPLLFSYQFWYPWLLWALMPNDLLWHTVFVLQCCSLFFTLC